MSSKDNATFSVCGMWHKTPSVNNRSMLNQGNKIAAIEFKVKGKERRLLFLNTLSKIMRQNIRALHLFWHYQITYYQTIMQKKLFQHILPVEQSLQKWNILTILFCTFSVSKQHHSFLHSSLHLLYNSRRRVKPFSKTKVTDLEYIHLLKTTQIID